EAPQQHFQAEHKTCEAHGTSPIASLRDDIMSGEQRAAGERCKKQKDDDYLSQLPAPREFSRLQTARPGPRTDDLEEYRASAPIPHFHPQFRPPPPPIRSTPSPPT